MNAQESPFVVGEQVLWRHEPRGGYGYVSVVDAVVVKVTPARVRIRVARRDGTSVERVVRPENLRHHRSDSAVR